MRWTRRPGQEQHRVLRRRVGWEVLAERGSQAQHLTRSLSDRGLMRPSQQFHGIHQHQPRRRPEALQNRPSST